MAIYIAADEPLPILTDHAGAVLYTSELRERDDQDVHQQFTMRSVVYAGSFEGCGCGFFTLEHDEYAEPEEVEQCRKSLAALAGYVADALQRGPVELFQCWEGDQGQPPMHHGVLTPEAIASGALKWDDRAVFTVQRAERS